jgi:phage terminase small subunit
MAKKTNKADKKLTEQEWAFVEEYVRTGEPKKSALFVKYSKSMASQAYKWCHGGKGNPKLHIWREIKKKMAARSKKTELSGDRVLEEMARLAFSNIQDFIGEENVIKDLTTIERNKAAAVKGIETERVFEYDDDGNATGFTDKVKLRFHGKERALESLFKYFGLFEKDNRQKASSLADLLKTLKED